jgi:hypothetical protein
MLEGYFFVHDFCDRENITFSLLKVFPHVKDWWDTYYELKSRRDPQCLNSYPLEAISGMLLRNNITLLEATMTSIQNGPNNVRVHKCLPYLAHQVGYKRL